MSEAGNEEMAGGGAGSTAGRGFTLTVAILAVYVASLGPVCFLNERGMLPPFAVNALEIVYWPIGLLYEHTPLKKPIDAYVDFWTRL